MTSSTGSDRNAAINAFLAEAGWGGGERRSLGEDASTRRYERVYQGSDVAVLMDAPPAAEGKPCGPDASTQERILAGWNGRTRLAACRVDAFVGVGEHLRSLGLSAPEVIAFDVEQGFALLEDLGDTIYKTEIENGASERELYLAATAALAHVHNAPAREIVSAAEWRWPILEYDTLALTTGADLFPKWYPAYDKGVKFSGSLQLEFDGIIRALSDYLASLPQVLMLRDYHAENLLWLPERDGLKKVGILDYQDAVRGPAAWDLAMFIQDARRDVSPAVAREVFRGYLALTGNEEESFKRDFDIAGAINALRIIGVFARLVRRDNKPKYEAFLPREWGHLKSSLQNPALKDLKRVLEIAAPQLKDA